jgi:hypothetical protein
MWIIDNRGYRHRVPNYAEETQPLLLMTLISALETTLPCLTYP